MYKSKLKKYKKMLLFILLLYYICLPLFIWLLNEEQLLKICFLFCCIALIIIGYVNFATAVRQDRYIEKNYKDIYHSFRYDRRRPLSISFMLLINREKDPRMKNLFEETKGLIKLNISVFAAMPISVVLTVFVKAFVIVYMEAV